MSNDSQAHFVATADAAAAGPFEVGTVQWVREFGSADRPELAAGYWYVTPEQAPETFPLTAALDESFHVLSGRVRIEFVGADTVELAEGDSISYNRGAEMLWTVLEPTVKFFVYSGAAQ